VERNINLDALTEDTPNFEGTAREACSIAALAEYAKTRKRSKR
jgi:hypothetical protein